MAEDDEDDAWSQRHGRHQNQEDETSMDDAFPTSRLRWGQTKRDCPWEEEEGSVSETTAGTRVESEEETTWDKLCGSPWKKMAMASLAVAGLCAVIALILFAQGARMKRELAANNIALDSALLNYTEAKDSFQRDVEQSQCTRYEDTFLSWLQAFCKIVNCTNELCHKYWTPYEGNCYYFSRTVLGWEESRQDCISQGSELLVIRSQEEQQYVADFNTSRMYWIGIKDRYLESSWTWVDGSPLQEGLIFWDRDYPDSYFDYDLEAFRNCVMLRNGAWANAVCSKANYWICKRRSEKPPIKL